MLKKSLVSLVVATVCLSAGASASADVTVPGSGEPQFTRSDNNTQWIEWSGAAWDSYALRITHIRDGQVVAEETVPVNKQGMTAIDWSGVLPLPLAEGHRYGICVQGRGTLGGIPANDGPDSCFNGDQSGKRTATTIDRTKPQISVALAAGADSADHGQVPLTISYSDSQSQPFPANFLCFGSGPDKETPCGEGDIYGHSQLCSAGSGGLTATFQCSVDTSSVNPDDGMLWACVTAADSSVPDNPSSADQTRAANTANLSDKQCDSIDLISAACTAAQAKVVKAKSKLKELKRQGASKPKLGRAKAKLRSAKAAVKGACE